MRSTYLYAGVTDLYLETGDETLAPVLDSCWQNLTSAKIYVNGGCGALYTGTSPFGLLFNAQYVHQAFGYEYQLPNVTAYNETCATIGNILWTYAHVPIGTQGARIWIIIERTYYNLVLAAVSLDGKKYFYENMLRRTKTLDYELMWPVERRRAFSSASAAPPTFPAPLPRASEYALSGERGYGLCGLYGASEADIRLNNGAAFTLVQTTDYPWNGDILLTVQDVKSDVPFTLMVRVPGWADGGTLTYAGVRRKLTAADADTFVEIAVPGGQNAAVEVRFDMPARYMEAHEKVEEDTAQVCVLRGPLVYCAEGHDLPQGGLDGLMLLSDARFVEEPCEIAGVPVVALRCDAAVAVRSPQSDPNALYQPLRTTGLRKESLRMIPYFAWDNRGFSDMKIWLPIHYTFGLREEETP